MGSGGPSNTTSTVTQTNLPAYVQPYFTGLLQRASTALTKDYQPYQDASGNPIQRIAGFTQAQKDVQNNILNQQTPQQFGQASNLAGLAGLGSLDTQSFTQPGMAQQYMSPYIQNALDVQKNQAIRDAQQGQLAANLGAARQGTYGGSRQLLAGMERERNLGQNLANIQATGMQQAYDNATKQFNAEQMARLQGLSQAGQMGQTLANIGQMQGQGDLARLGQQQSTAAQEQALQQQVMSQQYQDFINQRDWETKQLQQYSSLLHGVPVSANTTQTTSEPSPSLASQIMGTGLGALSAYKTLAG